MQGRRGEALAKSSANTLQVSKEYEEQITQVYTDATKQIKKLDVLDVINAKIASIEFQVGIH